ncbi:MAG TPA: hypothetical protein VEU30_17490, partial [Thermoanaerobaculia bacterium]|nr:hypothetical protein [Thermoanaerobaculia bacterium]
MFITGDQRLITRSTVNDTNTCGQRMMQLGGTFEVASSSSGTIVTVTVPMTARTAPADVDSDPAAVPGH